MQIHHLALILAGLAGLLAVLLFKLAVAVRQQRRGAVFAAPKAPRAPAVPDAVPETAEPPRQRNRQIVPVSVSEAAVLTEEAQQPDDDQGTLTADTAKDAPRGFYAGVEARLAALFESYEAGETSIAAYADAVNAEARDAEAHDSDLAAQEAAGTLTGAELDEARQEAEMAREAIAWCLDWAEAQQEHSGSPAEPEADPGYSAAA